MALDFRVIQGCPVDKLIGAYIAIVTADARATVNSIYRGDDAAAILHAHGKHTQRELFRTLAPGLANPPGYSTHELRSDGRAYPAYPRGSVIPWWAQGFDVNDGDVINVIHQGAGHGWTLFQPYSSGSEWHHLNFARQPRPTPHTLARILALRRTLPRQ